MLGLGRDNRQSNGGCPFTKTWLRSNFCSTLLTANWESTKSRLLATLGDINYQANRRKLAKQDRRLDINAAIAVSWSRSTVT